MSGEETSLSQQFIVPSQCDYLIFPCQEFLEVSKVSNVPKDTAAERHADTDTACERDDGTVDIMDEPQGENLFEKVSEQTVQDLNEENLFEMVSENLSGT